MGSGDDIDLELDIYIYMYREREIQICRYIDVLDIGIDIQGSLSHKPQRPTCNMTKARTVFSEGAPQPKYLHTPPGSRP